MKVENTKSQLANYVRLIDPEDTLCGACTVKGACCYGSVKHKGEVVGLRAAKCKLLGSDGRCMDYENRHEIVPECLDIVTAIRRHAVPDQCEYVKGLDWYKGKQLVDKELETELIVKLIKSLKKIPDYFSDGIKKIAKAYMKKS